MPLLNVFLLKVLLLTGSVEHRKGMIWNINIFRHISSIYTIENYTSYFSDLGVLSSEESVTVGDDGVQNPSKQMPKIVRNQII